MEAGLQAQLETTVAEAVNLYISYLQDDLRRQASTAAEARARLNPLIRLAPSLLVDVRQEHIRHRLDQLPAIASKKGTLARTNHFFGFAVRANLVSRNPCDGVIVEGSIERGKDTLTRTEARRFTAFLWTKVQDGSADADVAAAVIVLLYQGLRVSELLRLQVRDIDTTATNPLLSVERHAKSRTSYRDVELAPEVADLLRRRMVGRALTDWIWPSPRSASGRRGKTWLLKGTKRLCAAAGISVVCPQGLRGTHGKLARQAGRTAHDVRDQLGHESTRVTVQSYISEQVEANEMSKAARQVLNRTR
jgi:integrase